MQSPVAIAVNAMTSVGLMAARYMARLMAPRYMAKGTVSEPGNNQFGTVAAFTLARPFTAGHLAHPSTTDTVAVSMSTHEAASTSTHPSTAAVQLGLAGILPPMV